MFDLNEFVEATAPVIVELGDKEVSCVVRLNALSKNYLEELKDEDEGTYLMLCKIIVSWDIAVNGVLLPVNVESMRRLPTTLINKFTEMFLNPSRHSELKKPSQSESSPS